MAELPRRDFLKLLGAALATPVVNRVLPAQSVIEGLTAEQSLAADNVMIEGFKDFLDLSRRRLPGRGILSEAGPADISRWFNGEVLTARDFELSSDAKNTLKYFGDLSWKQLRNVPRLRGVVAELFKASSPAEIQQSLAMLEPDLKAFETFASYFPATEERISTGLARIAHGQMDFVLSEIANPAPGGYFQTNPQYLSMAVEDPHLLAHPQRDKALSELDRGWQEFRARAARRNEIRQRRNKAIEGKPLTFTHDGSVHSQELQFLQAKGFVVLPPPKVRMAQLTRNDNPKQLQTEMLRKAYEAGAVMLTCGPTTYGAVGLPDYHRCGGLVFLPHNDVVMRQAALVDLVQRQPKTAKEWEGRFVNYVPDRKKPHDMVEIRTPRTGLATDGPNYKSRVQVQRRVFAPGEGN